MNRYQNKRLANKVGSRLCEVRNICKELTGYKGRCLEYLARLAKADQISKWDNTVKFHSIPVEVETHTKTVMAAEFKILFRTLEEDMV